MKTNLSNKLGLVSMQAQEPYLTNSLNMGWRHLRVDPNHAISEQEKGKYDFEWFKPVVDKVYRRNGTILAGLFAIPAWTDPTQPLIGRWTYPAIALWKPELMTQPWVDFCNEFCRQFSDVIKTVALPTETNIYRVWANPDRTRPTVPRSATDYVELVVKPVMEVFRSYGMKVVLGSPTLRGANSKDFSEALEHVRQMREANGQEVGADFLDVHIYRTLGEDIVKDADRLFAHFAAKGKPIKNRIYVTESGVTESEAFTFWQKFWRAITFRPKYTGEMKQTRNCKPILEMLAADAAKPLEEQRFARWYQFRMFDPKEGGAGTDGLLRPDGSPKMAAYLISEYLLA